MKITMYVTSSSPSGSYVAGRTYEVDRETAAALIKAESARPADGSEPVENRKATRAGERAKKPAG